MITAKDFYHVLTALAPLYVSMVLAYAAVRWWKILTPEQCAGVNRLVALFSIPFYTFNFIISHDPYSINGRFVLSDTIQKVLVLVGLLLWETLISKRDALDWVLTFFSLATLPNTLIIGIPLLTAMYGPSSAALMVQLVLLQGVIWYTVILIIFEYRAAKILIAKTVSPDAVQAIASFRVETDIISLNDHESLCAETESANDGTVNVIVRNLAGSKSRRSSFSGLDYEITEVPREPVQGRASSTPADDQVARDHQDNVYVMLERGGDVGSIGGKSMERRGSRNIGATAGEGREHEARNGPALGASSPYHQRKMELEAGGGGGGEQEDRKKQMPATNVITWPIVRMVLRKMLKNPNIWASLLGLAWALISYKFDVRLPAIISQSILALSNTCSAMAMFSLGFFLALQPKLITCGKLMACLAMVTRFLIGPVIAGAVSAAIGLRGDLLRISIVQAALPQAIVSFVYAKEYDSQADILSTTVTFGMIVALPVTIIYFILLGL